MSSFHLSPIGKPSIKDHPYYAEAMTTALLGFGLLGPELTAAVAIAVHGWLSWEKPNTGFGNVIPRSLPLSNSMIQDSPPNLHTGPMSSLDVLFMPNHQAKTIITEQVMNKFDKLPEILQPQSSTLRTTTANPYLVVAQDSHLPASNPALPSPGKKSSSKTPPDFSLQHQILTAVQLPAKRDAFMISWQPQILQLHQQLSFETNQKHEAEQMLVKAGIEIRSLRSTIVERDETIVEQDKKSQGLMVELHDMERLSNAREAQHKALETEFSDLQDHRQLQQDQAQENEQLKTQVDGLQKCRFLLQNKQRENEELNDKIRHKEQLSNAREAQYKTLESEVGRLRNCGQLLQDCNMENQQLRTQVADLKAQLSGHQPIHVVQDLRVLKAENTISQRLLGDGHNLEGLPGELQRQLRNVKGSRLLLEAKEGEVQYILVDVNKPQMGYYFPIYNQLMITSGSSSPVTYTALKPGFTMDSVPRDVQERYSYEVEFGDMFPRCILRLTEPLVNAQFDYMLRHDPYQPAGAEFPVEWKDYLDCQMGMDLETIYSAPFANSHRKHLGVKASVQIVNKQCFPLNTLKNREGATIVHGYDGPQSLVRNGDRESWDFDMIHTVGGQGTQLRVVDAATYLSEMQPWDGEVAISKRGDWNCHQHFPQTYLLPNERVLGRTLLARQEDGKDYFAPVCPEWSRIQPNWEASKQRPTTSQHPVLDSIDPAHFYRQRMNIVSTDVFGGEEEKRDLALAGGRSFQASQFSAFSNDGSEMDICVCEFEQMCLACLMKFGDFSWPQLAPNCQNWVEELPYDNIDQASEDGALISQWKGEIAFKSETLLLMVDSEDPADLVDAANSEAMAEHNVSFMELEATPDAVVPDEDMPLPVGPWTGQPQTFRGRYMWGGHLMIDAVGIKWVRFFPLTGHYMVSAKTINKIQRFGMPGQDYKENHPGWKEFCDQTRSLTSWVEHPDVGAVLHTRAYVDKMIIDHSLPIVIDHPVRYDITMGQVYNEFEMQDLYHLAESQVAQILPMFRNGKNGFDDKVGRIETLCPWKYKFYGENGKATINAPRSYKISQPQRLRNSNASRKQKPKPKPEDTNVSSAEQETTRAPTWAQVAKQAELPRDRKAPSLTPDNSSEDSSNSHPTTPVISTPGPAVKQKSLAIDKHLAS